MSQECFPNWMNKTILVSFLSCFSFLLFLHMPLAEGFQSRNTIFERRRLYRKSDAKPILQSHWTPCKMCNSQSVFPFPYRVLIITKHHDEYFGERLIRLCVKHEGKRIKHMNNSEYFLGLPENLLPRFPVTEYSSNENIKMFIWEQ